MHWCGLLKAIMPKKAIPTQVKNVATIRAVIPNLTVMQCLCAVDGCSEEECQNKTLQMALYIIFIKKWKDLTSLLLSSLEIAWLLPSLQSQTKSSFVDNLQNIVKLTTSWIKLSVLPLNEGMKLLSTTQCMRNCNNPDPNSNLHHGMH